MTRLERCAEDEQASILAELRAATSLDWGKDVMTWQLWWREDQKEHGGARGARTKEILTPSEEATYQALREVGIIVQREQIRGHDHMPYHVYANRGLAHGLRLPDFHREPVYYLGGQFEGALMRFLHDLGIAVEVKRADQGFILVICGVATAIPDRPRVRIFALLRKLLSERDPRRALWIETNDHAWRLSEPQLASWNRHMRTALRSDPLEEREPVDLSPPMRLPEQVVPTLEYQLIDAECFDDDVTAYEGLAVEQLARIGITATCTVVVDDDAALVIESGGKTFTSGPLDERGYIDSPTFFACLNEVVAAHGLDRTFVALFHDNWGTEIGIAIADARQRAALVKAGLVELPEADDEV